MKLACIDTSTFTESVALVEGEALKVERSVCRAYGHASGLHHDLAEMLIEAEWSLSELDAFVMGVGPGSFTGLRVGMAAIKGLAYALEKPLYGVRTSRALLSALVDQRDSLALIDARRGEVYAEGPLLTSPRCLTPDALISILQEQGVAPRIFVGEGALKHRARFVEAWPELCIPRTEACHLPRASLLASGLTQLIEQGTVSPDHVAALEPIYVRKSDAEINYPDGFPSEARLFK